MKLKRIKISKCKFYKTLCRGVNCKSNCLFKYRDYKVILEDSDIGEGGVKGVKGVNGVIEKTRNFDPNTYIQK